MSRVGGHALWMGCLLVGFVGIGVAQPALAQEQPPNSTSTTQPYQPTLDPEELELTPLEAAQLNEVLGDDELANPCDAGSESSGQSAAIVPDDCWGRFPSSHYDIGCDEGAWNHISRKVYCTFTDLAFQGARSTTAFGLWLVEWTYGFGIYDRLGGPMIELTHSYERNIVGPLELRHVAWTYAIAWAAIVSLRGRATAAFGELCISVVLAGLAGLVLANPAGYLDGAFRTLGTVSSALLSTGTGQPPPDDAASADAVIAPLQAQIHKAFVEDPYDHLNWGGPLPDTCAAIRDRLIAVGPHGNSDGPREAMNAGGCTEQADFNHDPSGQRLFGAVLTFTAALCIVVLLVLVAVTIVVAQVIAVILFAIAPFASLGAVLTGGGREIAWRWLAALARVGLVVVGMSFALSVLLLATQALLSAEDGGGIVERFVLVNLVVIAAFVIRKRIISAGAQLASQLGSRLSTGHSGGASRQPWLGPTAAGAIAGGISGYGLASSVGLDQRSRTGRLTSFAARDLMADRRLRRHSKRAEKRAKKPVARERTEYTQGSDGQLITRRSVSVDGPAVQSHDGRRLPRPIRRIRSARAQRAREKVETAAERRAQHFPAFKQPGGMSPPDQSSGETPWPNQGEPGPGEPGGPQEPPPDPEVMM